MTFSLKTIEVSVALILFGLGIGYTFAQFSPRIPLIVGSQSGYTYSGSMSKNVSNTVFQSKKIQNTINLIQKNYYGFDAKTGEEIEDAVLKSIVNGLGDRHSTYFSKKETSSFEEMLRGDFEGIGAVINEHPDGVKVMKIIVKSPAEKAGLKAGDIITLVDGKKIAGLTTEEAIKLIRGKKGTQVILSYKRGELASVSELQVTRDVVNIPSVSEKIIDKNIGYIEVATFGEHTTKEFVKSWNTLISSGAQSMILDFRNNGGGYLETAVDLSSIMLGGKKPVVIIKSNPPRPNEVLLTRAGIKSNTTIPIIVLVNSYSASASEIFAGALQDHKRAIILGEQSYGKGSVQEPFELGDGSMVKITIAKWYTPNDKSIDEKGITPDIKVLLTEKDYHDIYDRQLEAAKIVIKEQMKSGATLQKMLESYKSNTFLDLKK